MLNFSTKLYVSDELTSEVFINRVIEWVRGGDYYTFGEIIWNNEEEFTVENPDKTQRLDIFLYDNNRTVAVHLSNKDGQVLWINDYVLRDVNDKRILAVQLYSEPLDVSVKQPRIFNRPRLLKKIVEDGFGGIDCDISVSDRFVMINKENIEIIENVIKGKQQYFMPIVYVSEIRGDWAVNCKELAKDLAGVAHVFVENDSSVCRWLRDNTDYQNPYNGAVQVYYSSNASMRFLPQYATSPNHFRKQITYSIFERLTFNKIDEGLTWNSIRLRQLQSSKQNSDELYSISEQMLLEAESNFRSATNRIEELETENNRLMQKLNAYENGFNKREEVNSPIFFESQETEFYNNEFNDILLRIIEKEIKSMDGNQNLKERRKYHVLTSILRQNQRTNYDSEIMLQIKDALGNNNDLSKRQIRLLEDLGFSVEEGEHYKLTYKNDSRYMFTISKTSSDSRGKKNLMSEIKNTLFE